jgi:antitoxin ParD1/3/4
MPSSVDLGTKLERTIDGLVARGRYRSRSEVLREGVRLVQEREARLVALDASIRKGVSDADQGRLVPAGTAFKQLAARYRRKVPRRK